MRITAINGEVFNNRRNIISSRKKSVSTYNQSFQADYSDKPVPPVGKAVAAASVLALLAAMTGVSKCDNDENVYNNDDVREQVFELVPDELEHSSYKPVSDEEDIPQMNDNLGQVDEPVLVDTLSQDSIAINDSIGQISKDSVYKFFPNGDTVIVTPIRDSSHTDSTHRKH